jgi:hypothetical protein
MKNVKTFRAFLAGQEQHTIALGIAYLNCSSDVAVQPKRVPNVKSSQGTAAAYVILFDVREL